MVEGHLSVYEVLTHLGDPYPSRTWKKLLKLPAEMLPRHARKQFIMKDGRKSRMLPAIPIEDFDRLVLLLEQVNTETEVVTLRLDAESELLEVLSEAFQDFEPSQNVEVGDLRLDLYFARANVAVVLVSRRVSGQQRLLLDQRIMQAQAELECRFLKLEPDAEGFRLGQAVFELRQLLEHKEIKPTS
ncbi:hypothetical protein DC3_39760 [Deinococcus cellulosilyticus NBRC 106333 = KACC 11606]|uniref:Uncharacterized protein n=1 Tax=Deinococcus cellulosilyticus (strain DSM 18568 / NBRC 106333 / KACC 11606 / 5516J-15) TaxID=1223518 RepID=A0A511N7E8_DEIC1|nr:hypothetical protein DC3_39760 [Deinococcus cellulosilyticus NBRC 106333 = KACC 11606]